MRVDKSWGSRNYKCHKDITACHSWDWSDHPHREVTTRYVAEYNEAVSKVANFMKEKGNHKSHLLTQNCTILRQASVSQ